MKIREIKLDLAMKNGDKINSKRNWGDFEIWVYCNKPFVWNFVGFIYMYELFMLRLIDRICAYLKISYFIK